MHAREADQTIKSVCEGQSVALGLCRSFDAAAGCLFRCAVPVVMCRDLSLVVDGPATFRRQGHGHVRCCKGLEVQDASTC